MLRLVKKLRQNKKSRRASSLVEFAIVGPVVIMTIFGTVDICCLYNLRSSIKLGAYQACRMGVTPGCTATTCRAQAQVFLDSRRIRNYTIQLTPADPSTLTTGQFLTVTVTAPTSENLPLQGWFTQGRSVTATVSMVSER